MILSLDSQSRLQILQALKDSAMGDIYALISLPEGYQLLFLAHAGNIAFCLVDDLGDLFDPHSMMDVSELVMADLERNRELIASAQGVLNA